MKAIDYWKRNPHHEKLCEDTRLIEISYNHMGFTQPTHTRRGGYSFDLGTLATSFVGTL
jgi:hypothetical protein